MNALTVADIQIRGSPAITSPLPGLHVGRASGEPAFRGTGSAAADPEATPEQIEQAAEGVNAFLKSSGSHVQFALHQETQRMMVEVIDDRTQEVVKTIPPKSLLDLAAKIGEMVGVFVDKKG